MHLNILHLDDALASQPDFLAACCKREAHHVDVRAEGLEVRLWGRTDAMRKLRLRLEPEIFGLTSHLPVITWMGSGDFHHITALIVSLLATKRQTPITIVHIDNHPDWVKFGNGIHCGSWVSHVLEQGIVARVVSVGMTSRDLSWPEFKGADLEHIASSRLVMFPLDPPRTFVARNYGKGPAHTSRGRQINWSRLTDTPDKAAIDAVLSVIETEHIYITVDKDALTDVDAKTNWDQGRLSLDLLLAWLQTLMAKCKVVGMDVVGDYSPPVHGGGPLDRLWKRAEVLLDQPVASVPIHLASRINERTNLSLLATLEEQLC